MVKLKGGLDRGTAALGNSETTFRETEARDIEGMDCMVPEGSRER